MIPLITVRTLTGSESLASVNEISVIGQEVIQILPSFWNKLLAHPLFTLNSTIYLIGFGQTVYTQAPLADTATEIAEEVSIKELSQWLNSDSSNRHITLSPNPSFAELIEFKVYNRWGEVIFQSFDGSTTPIGWNGLQSDGEQADSGFYVYMAKVRLENGTEKSFTGDLYLKGQSQ